MKLVKIDYDREPIRIFDLADPSDTERLFRAYPQLEAIILHSDDIGHAARQAATYLNQTGSRSSWAVKA